MNNILAYEMPDLSCTSRRGEGGYPVLVPRVAWNLHIFHHEVVYGCARYFGCAVGDFNLQRAGVLRLLHQGPHGLRGQAGPEAGEGGRLQNHVSRGHGARHPAAVPHHTPDRAGGGSRDPLVRLRQQHSGVHRLAQQGGHHHLVSVLHRPLQLGRARAVDACRASAGRRSARHLLSGL